MTSVLNLLQAITLFRLYESHGCKLDYFFNYIPVSLRQFADSDSSINSFQLGNCVGGLNTAIANELTNVNDNAELKSKFWPLAQHQSVLLEDRAKNDLCKFLPPRFPENMNSTQLFGHMSLSNVGVIDLSSYECFGNGSFRVENMYAVCNYKHPCDKFLMASFFCTVGQKLCCSLASDSFFFDHELADQFVDIFKQTLQLVV